ncbi:MAG: hypothetical protein IT241_10225, partial [Bacteroidia bacterium]|nr:hypothetical protein [Bacteroidia bacterium]
MSPSSFLSQFRPAIRKSVNLLVLVLLVISTVNAQSKRELEQRKIKLQKEINEANRQLAKLAKSKTATLAQIDALKKKIKARSALIATVNSEINLIGQEINQTDLSISSLETEMKELRQGYANMILYAQKNNNRFKRLYFIFAADNFNQAYKRIIFLKQINQYRNQQAILIDSTQAELSRKKSELELQRNQKTLLRNNELKERQQLASEKKQQDLLMAGMQNQEKKLRAQVAEKQKA